ncbi:uncharacterized protein LOC142354154 [Convolutriloba macropyga]|uniref:uncharacterized protein LOC142354154 n=1 Tax=Convolutriloba macropyga TaxID=536237 RepID=UPI003F5237F5
MDQDKNTHGGALIAVKNSFISERVISEQPDSSLVCKIQLAENEIFICAFYNPPRTSPYRYEESLYRQIINLPTCGQNTLDVAFYKNCNLVAQLDEKFSSIYDCSDLKSTQLTLECPSQDAKETLGNFRSFGNADYESINKILSTEPFKPVCFTNINNICEEFYQYMDQIFEVYVPKRTRHRQSLPPWISSFTSYNMKRLQTQKRLLSEKPTSYRKQEVLKLENQLIESSEPDRIEYQEKIMRAGNTGTIFKHLKSLKKSPSLPKLLIKENQQSTKMQEQVNMMNEFFHSGFSPKIPFSIQDVKLRNPEITNFEISKKAIYEILLSLDATKSRGPNGIPPAFFQRTARETSKNLNVLFKQIKRLRKIPNSWKIAAVTPIYKKDDRRKVENYRPVSLLDIDSKVFENCICSALYAHLEKFLTEHQMDLFVKKIPNRTPTERL